MWVTRTDHVVVCCVVSLYLRGNRTRTPRTSNISQYQVMGKICGLLVLTIWLFVALCRYISEGTEREHLHYHFVSIAGHGGDMWVTSTLHMVVV